MDPELSVRGGSVAVAVFHPGGILLGSIPTGVDGDERLGADLPAQGNKVVGVDLAVIVTHGVGLGLQAQIGLEGGAHIHRQKAVHPVEFPGEVSAWPAQHFDAQFLHGFHHIAAHPVEVVLGQQGDGPNTDMPFLFPADSQVSVGIRGLGGKFNFKTGPISPLPCECGAAIDFLPRPVR